MPSWGKQITQQAAIALVVFLVLVGLLIWIYFRDAKMSVAALLALGHDLVITIGVYALVGFTVTPATMIGVLTILGYSLYDTVVVFDKVRENVAAMETNKVTYTEAANHAVNQVLVRSLNTTIIGVLPVAAILFAGVFVLGSGPLEDLGLALFVGMIAGAYSSIFIATPLLAQLREREPEMTAHRERVERRRRAAEQRASFKTTTVDVPTPATAPAASTPESAITVTTVAAPKAAVKVEDEPVARPESTEAIEPDAVEPEDADGGRRGRRVVGRGRPGRRSRHDRAQAVEQADTDPSQAVGAQHMATQTQAERIALVASLIRDVPDFPKPGVVYKDITPLLGDHAGYQAAVDALVEAAPRTSTSSSAWRRAGSCSPPPSRWRSVSGSSRSASRASCPRTSSASRSRSSTGRTRSRSTRTRSRRTRGCSSSTTCSPPAAPSLPRRGSSSSSAPTSSTSSSSWSSASSGAARAFPRWGSPASVR